MKKQTHSPMSKQRLVVRPNHPGKLTNNICILRNKFTDECQEWSLMTYDLTDYEFRKRANDFSIACSVGGKRFRICLEYQGYCRQTRVCLNRKRKWYTPWKKTCTKSEFKVTKIDAIKGHQYLLEAGTECYRGY